MSTKSARIAAELARPRGGALNPYYLGYFDCFNHGRFYEAHEVLEELWMQDRRGPEGDFYKGLIQLAGAFVLMQKERRAPAARLLKLASANLRIHAPVHQHLDVNRVLTMIEQWLQRLGHEEAKGNPLKTGPAPRLSLIP